MSLLEDVFLEDEANEARELEMIIEGDQYEERPGSSSPSGDESDNDKREEEAEEDKRRVDPSSTKTRKVTRNPRITLNPARLTGPRGIQVIPEHFKDFKFKGKDHEKEDLDMLLKKLEHWAYRLYPKFQFQDCLKKIETLGKKRPVMVHLHKIRTDQFLSEETVVQNDSSDEETQQPQEEDEFDKLLQQQIELARATPAPGSVTNPTRQEYLLNVKQSPTLDHRSHLTMPKASSSPSISDEQKERMLRNRKLAEERRLARLKQATSNNTVITDAAVATVENTSKVTTENIANKETNITNVNSSDSEEECNVISVKKSIVVDVYENTQIDVDRTGSDETNIRNDSVGSVVNNEVQNDNIDVIRSDQEHFKENLISENYKKISTETNQHDKVILDENNDNENLEGKNLGSVSNKEQNETTIVKDIDENYVDDVMDVDFSEDF